MLFGLAFHQDVNIAKLDIYIIIKSINLANLFYKTPFIKVKAIFFKIVR